MNRADRNRTLLLSLSTEVSLDSGASTRLEGSIALVQRRSAGRGPWETHKIAAGEAELVPTADEVIEAWCGRAWEGYCAVRVGRRHGDVKELLSFGPRIASATESPVRIEMIVKEVEFEPLFVSLSSCLQIPFGVVIPEFELEWPEQIHVLEMALTRRFEPSAFDERARALARRVPKLQAAAAIGAAKYPHRLGWLNYWPSSVCEWAGYPDASRDEEILALSYPVEEGAWVVKLTEEPLDLARDDHITALVRAYERFDMVGRRPSPRVPRTAKRRHGGGHGESTGDEARAVAQVTVGAWDMNADDARDGAQLRSMVVDALIEHGFDESTTEQIIEKFEVALGETFEDPQLSARAESFRGDPMYEALLAEVRKAHGRG